MTITQKLMGVVQALKDAGWEAAAYGDRQGWGILVMHIDEGPRFDYLVRLDYQAFSPFVTISEICADVIRECRRAMRDCTDQIRIGGEN